MRIKTKLAILLAIVGICFGMIQPQVFAATGVIYISPASSSVQNGNYVTVSLRINPGTSVNTVQATVGYSTAKLQFISSSLGVFSACTKDSGGGGSVSFACAILGSSTSSDSLIASIKFKALAGSGSTALSVTNAEAANSGGTYTNPSSSGGTVSFTSPSTSSSGSSSSSSSTHYNYYATPAAPKKPAKPVTVTTKTTKVQYGMASIAVSTNMSVQSHIQYGTAKNSLKSKSPLSKAGKSVTINLTSLTPGTTYYYQAVTKATDAAKLSKSPVQSFTTKGFTVQVTVLDSKYRPLTGKIVTLHSTPMKATTNNLGVATFTSVAPGLHHVEYSVGSHTYVKQAYVASSFKTSKDGTQTASTQSVAIVLANYTQPQPAGKSPVLPIIAVASAVIVSGAIVAFILRKKLLGRLMRAKQSGALPFRPYIKPHHFK